MNENEPLDFELDADQHAFLVEASRLLGRQLSAFWESAAGIAHGWKPAEPWRAAAVASRIQSTHRQRAEGKPSYFVPLQRTWLPVVRLALEAHLERLRTQAEEVSELSPLDEHPAAIKASIEIGHQLLAHPSLLAVEAIDVSPSNYFNLETIARLPQNGAVLRDRVYDDKFHTLMSPALFLPDLRYFREQCSFRDRPVSVAYVDIDKFGDFNRNLPGRETQVDRDILPRFMRALEASVYGRGFAYREGGDEYLVLLPNCEHADAATFFDGLRQRLAGVDYPIDMPGPTVSIGVCTASAKQRLTPRQIKQFANLAKSFAKGERNRVAGFEPEQPHSEETLTLLGGQVLVP